MKKKRYFEFTSPTSNKFWQIELNGKSHTVNFGRVATSGQSQTKRFADEEKAEKSYEKLITQKLKKGYSEKNPKGRKGRAPNRSKSSVVKSRTKSQDRFKLDAAYKALRKRGVICLHNAGYSLNDGFYDAKQAFARHPKQDKIIGLCYYHQQDSGGARDGHGMNLAFGSARPEDEKKLATTIGKMIVEELEKAGLKVKWNGKLTQRITMPEFAWYEPSASSKEKQSVSKKSVKKKSTKSAKKKSTKKSRKKTAKQLATRAATKKSAKKAKSRRGKQ